MPAVSPPPEAVTTTTSGVEPESVQIVDDFAPGGALAGDDQSVVVRRHKI
jgi:hypothetical protein